LWISSAPRCEPENKIGNVRKECHRQTEGGRKPICACKSRTHGQQQKAAGRKIREERKKWGTDSGRALEQPKRETLEQHQPQNNVDDATALEEFIHTDPRFSDRETPAFGTATFALSPSWRDNPAQVGQIFEEDTHVRCRLCAHEFLVHVGLPSELLDILVPADVDEALAAIVIAIPEVLHHTENPEHGSVGLHELLTRQSEVSRI
jgi:hypothetical protein